ncbi:unnamed protein product [Penicillium pancosmium]
MASLRQILGLSRSDENPPRSCLTWHRRHRTETPPPPPYQTELDTVPDIPDSAVHHPGSERTSETRAESHATVQHDEDAPADDDGSQPSAHASTTQETARKSAASSLSRPRGSNPLKSIITRFHHNKSNKPNEQSESSEAARPLHHRAEGEGSELPVRTGPPDPFSPLSRNPPSAGSEATEQQRTVSAQTAETQDSENTSVTVHRHSSQPGLQTPVLELQQDCFSPTFFADYVPETSHFAEGSDPFADRITPAPPTLAQAPSKRSSKSSSARSSNQSSRHTPNQSSKQPSHEPCFFSSRHTSNASYASRTFRLDPVRAANGFNSLSDQYNLQIGLDEEVPANVESISVANKVDQDHVQIRNRVLRIRPVQSNMEIVTQAPILPKLRRTKTFANLTRQKKPTSMTALQGRSLESMSRLGGHSYLV